MPRSSLPCATWFRLIKCWTEVGEVNDEYPTSAILGVFPTRAAAVKAANRKGLKKDLSRSNSGDEGYRIREVLVVFTGKSRTKGLSVSNEHIELSSARNKRRGAILKKATRAGIPLRVINLSKIE